MGWELRSNTVFGAAARAPCSCALGGAIATPSNTPTSAMNFRSAMTPPEMCGSYHLGAGAMGAMGALGAFGGFAGTAHGLGDHFPLERLLHIVDGTQPARALDR